MGLLLLAAVPSFGKGKLMGTINMNTASAEQLDLLPGIGESRAQQILALRTKKPFSGIDDLLEIKGVGEKMLASWASYLVFEGTTTLKEVNE